MSDAVVTPGYGAIVIPAQTLRTAETKKLRGGTDCFYENT